MEDILASIRRILSEDEQPETAATVEPPAPPPARPPSLPPPPAPPVDDEDVLDLDASMLVMESPSSAMEIEEPPFAPAAAAEPPADPLGIAPPPLPPPPPLARPAEPEPWPPMSAEGLVAPAAAAAAASSVGALMRTLAAERATALHRGGPTIEDLVREEIRPLLKSWLDIHLPPLVERLVRAEIERVVGRALP